MVLHAQQGDIHFCKSLHFGEKSRTTDLYCGKCNNKPRMVILMLSHLYTIRLWSMSSWDQDGFKMVQVSTQFWCQKSSKISGLGCWWISIIDHTPGSKTCTLLRLRRNRSRSYWGRWWNRPFPSASPLPDTKIKIIDILKTVVPCCSSISLSLLGRIWYTIHENFAASCEEKLWRSKPSKSALSIEP